MYEVPPLSEASILNSSIEAPNMWLKNLNCGTVSAVISIAGVCIIALSPGALGADVSIYR